jgi:hypothetical protein
MKDSTQLGLSILAALAVASLVFWIARRNYVECRATPHTMFYCLTHGR